jgi:hypothetical protein
LEFDVKIHEYESLITEEPSNGLARLKGKVVVSIIGAAAGHYIVTFTCSDGSVLEFYHSQDCCESVVIEDVTGDINDLLNSPIIMASEETSRYEGDGYTDSGTWTFYKFATIKGYVTIRWLGTSNGYYSETVDYVWKHENGQ